MKESEVTSGNGQEWNVENHKLTNEELLKKYGYKENHYGVDEHEVVAALREFDRACNPLIGTDIKAVDTKHDTLSAPNNYKTLQEFGGCTYGSVYDKTAAGRVMHHFNMNTNKERDAHKERGSWDAGYAEIYNYCIEDKVTYKNEDGTETEFFHGIRYDGVDEISIRKEFDINDTTKPGDEYNYVFINGELKQKDAEGQYGAVAKGDRKEIIANAKIATAKAKEIMAGVIVVKNRKKDKDEDLLGD